MYYQTISLLDPSVCSSNLGDQIIIDSVKKILFDVFKEVSIINIPTHDIISKVSYKYMKESDFKIVGGTNLLSSNMNSYNQWKINLWDSLFIKDVILMGVGWWQYQKKPNLYTKILYHRVLHKGYLHSVRDNYTKRQLESIGINNVVNTACPTMWSLTDEHCEGIPRRKSDSVLVTFTEYNQNQGYDSDLIELLREKYSNIYFWIQQPKDYKYMYSIYGNKAIYVQPSLQALDQVLTLDLDYIGTRLHAGVRALQKKKRALILAVDNRAAEISKDTNLPVVPRNDWKSITSWIESAYETRIRLPWSNIDKWKSQFQA